MSDLKITFSQQQQLQQDIPYYYPNQDISTGKIIISKLDNKERFTYITYQIYIKFLEYDIDILDIKEINDFLLSKNTIDTIKKIEFINPLVFILGYLVTKETKRKDIDKKKFITICNYVIKNNDNKEPLLSKIIDLNIDSISSADILRYSRFWKEKLWIKYLL